MEQATFDALMAMTWLIACLVGGYLFGLKAGKATHQAVIDCQHDKITELHSELEHERQALARACQHNHTLRAANDDLGQKLTDLTTEVEQAKRHLRRAADLEQMVVNLKDSHTRTQAEHQQHIQLLQDRAIELHQKLEQASEAQGTLTALEAYAQLLRDTARRWHPDHELQRKLKPQEILDHRACLKELADIVEGKADALTGKAA